MLQAQRLQFERRLRFCGPEVAAVDSSLELTVGSSSKEKPTDTRAVTEAAALQPNNTAVNRKDVLRFPLVVGVSLLPPRPERQAELKGSKTKQRGVHSQEPLEEKTR
jgi:hypothetical protein